MMQSLVVLGMHRSGTSALARSIADLGAWTGSEAFITRRGEHQLMQDCNQEILKCLDGHWSAPPSLDAGWEHSAALAPLAESAAAALRDFDGHPVIAWKDPRNCFTLPYWRTKMVAEPIVMFIVRHPLEVAASLDKRNGFRPGHAAALWEAYNRAALRSMQGLRVSVVHYADLVAAPIETISRVLDDLRTFGVAMSETAERGIDRIDPNRRHHVADVSTPSTHLTSNQRELLDELQHLAPSSQAFSASIGESHPASHELLLERAKGIRLERELAGAHARLRSRRQALRRVFTKE
jgi:hypothetical protein